MYSQMINRPCSLLIRTSTGRDAHGIEQTTDTVVVTLCEVQQVGADENPLGEVGDTTYRAFFLPGVVFDIGDGLVVDGLEYEFIGVPDFIRDPFTQRQDHVEVIARRTAGSEGAS